MKMANLIIREKSIFVRFTRFETLRALQKSFEIPLDKVRGATCDNEYIQSGLGLRSPGTGFPGYIAEGTFRKNGQKILSLWKKGQQVVVIELEDSRWDRILLGCIDAKATTTELNRALNEQMK